MAFNQNNNQAAQNPFWDWVRSLDPAGSGVDHPAQGQFPFWPPPPPPAPGHHHEGPPHPPPPPPGPHGPPPHHDSHNPGQFPFGPGGLFGGRGGGFCGGPPGMGGFGGGRRGRHGPHHHREGSPSHERSASQEGEKSGSDGEGREHSPHRRHGRRGHHDRRGGRGGRGFGRRGPPPHPFAGPNPMFDMSGLMQALASHPLAQAWRGYAEQAAGQQSGETLVPEDVGDENSFTPPIDIFSTETSFVLHVALPGAKKEDVGINWDAEKSILNIAGVVYRLGDEEFLKCLSKSERKVGAFERAIKLPPGSQDKDEIDGDGITAKLEDGVLAITVPKVEKEWTEVRKVDII
ncbi:hsp20 alpha crystallin family protein [Phlyctema vagabunda]|uniref:Hsp20 alpha crystallin family protein n=1 Tax=Phlyctema vagabunda TaxID=108571 RepID=A0ABR4P7I6_9HELO